MSIHHEDAYDLVVTLPILLVYFRVGKVLSFICALLSTWVFFHMMKVGGMEDAYIPLLAALLCIVVGLAKHNYWPERKPPEDTATKPTSGKGEPLLSAEDAQLRQDINREDEEKLNEAVARNFLGMTAEELSAMPPRSVNVTRRKRHSATMRSRRPSP